MAKPSFLARASWRLSVRRGHPANGETVSVVGPAPRPGEPARVGPVFGPPPDPPRYAAPDDPLSRPLRAAPEEPLDRAQPTAPMPPPEPPHYTDRAPRPVEPRIDAVSSEPGAPARSRRTIIAVVALLVVAAAAIGAVLLRPLLDTTATAPPAAAGTAIVLAAPADDGSSVTLSWTGPAGLDFGVDVAAEGAAAETTYAGRATSTTLAVQPGVRYSFQVRATNGQDVYSSNVQPLRGATCAT